MGNRRGFTLAELMVTIAVLGIMTAISAPSFITYWHTARLRAAAQELMTIVNSGRELAIRTNNFVCVEQGGTQVRFRSATAANCAGVPWVGNGTDPNGWFTLDNAIQASGATQNVIFTYLGAANPAGVYTVLNPTTGQTLTVTVANSGRVTIP